jgi:hypothetical protein
MHIVVDRNIDAVPSICATSQNQTIINTEYIEQYKYIHVPVDLV